MAETSTTKTYLAFDFGMKRIGVAVGQDITKTANPLAFLRARDGIPNWDDIKTLIDTWKPAALVVGIPLCLDDSAQLMTYCSKKFIHRLEQRFQLPVHGMDERYSSKEARSRLFEAGGYKRLQRGEIDSMAAKLILEDWLKHDYEKNP